MNSDQVGNGRRGGRNLPLLMGFNFLLDFRPYSAVAVLYFAQVSGSFAKAGLVFSVVMLSSALLDVPTGVLSDRVGRRTTAVLGALATVVAVTCYAIGHLYLIVLAGAVLEGLGRALYSGNNQALLYDTLAEQGWTERYAHYAGRVSAMLQIALVISAGVGSFIVARWSFALMMWASVLPQALCLCVALFFIEPRPLQRGVEAGRGRLLESLSVIRANPQLLRLIASSAIGYAVGETGFQFLPAFVATVWPVWAIGLGRMLSNLLATVSFWLSGRVIGRLGASATLLWGQLLTWIVTVLAVIRPVGVSPLLLSSESLAYGCCSVASSTMLQGEFSDRERATISSLGSAANSLLFAAYAFFAGVMVDHLGPARALLIGQAVVAPALVLAWLVHRHARRAGMTRVGPSPEPRTE